VAILQWISPTTRRGKSNNPSLARAAACADRFAHAAFDGPAIRETKRLSRRFAMLVPKVLLVLAAFCLSSLAAYAKVITDWDEKAVALLRTNGGHPRASVERMAHVPEHPPGPRVRSTTCPLLQSQPNSAARPASVNRM
jgi:hypothetical protein